MKHQCPYTDAAFGDSGCYTGRSIETKEVKSEGKFHLLLIFQVAAVSTPDVPLSRKSVWKWILKCRK